MKILIDTREQAPYSFQGKYYQDVKIEHGALQSGDYSLAGLTDRIAIERKELPDLIQCLGRERERFEREMQRAAAEYITWSVLRQYLEGKRKRLDAILKAHFASKITQPEPA